ncbi:unnamed protein product [Microthlaspi erraticum]|uniref:RING-type E3 ubiquitin transferase n=1 Tax=Microthlaspi erraticum TaxID=1685480 RepID=A0A6D2KMD4_9BRAS|nr:unnamed protein product [Microthlaspi erraticum]
MSKLSQHAVKEAIASIYLSNSTSRSSNDENDDTNSSAMLLDLEALNCPICYDALTSNIFQCDNGHLACSACCSKLKNKCPSCTLPVGHSRCRAMERVIQSVMVPCPKGCTKSFSYGKELAHEKECHISFPVLQKTAINTVTDTVAHHEKDCASSSCSCPAKECCYSDSYKNLYNHFKTHESERGCGYRIIAGGFPEVVHLESSAYTSVVMNESRDGLLFVVQCFSEPHGVYVTMNCIAPCVPEVCEFSCHMSTVMEEHNNMTFDLPKVKRVRKLSLETPEEDFMLVPRYFLRGRQALELRICVRKFNRGKI